MLRVLSTSGTCFHARVAAASVTLSQPWLTRSECRSKKLLTHFAVTFCQTRDVGPIRRRPLKGLAVSQGQVEEANTRPISSRGRKGGHDAHDVGPCWRSDLKGRSQGRAEKAVGSSFVGSSYDPEVERAGMMLMMLAHASEVFGKAGACPRVDLKKSSSSQGRKGRHMMLMMLAHAPCHPPDVGSYDPEVERAGMMLMMLAYAGWELEMTRS